MDGLLDVFGYTTVHQDAALGEQWPNVTPLDIKLAADKAI